MKQIGEQCRVYYDADEGQEVKAGDFLQTTTGRMYLVDTVRIQERGLHVGRHHLVVTVVPPDVHLFEEDVVHPIAWYSRKRRPADV